MGCLSFVQEGQAQNYAYPVQTIRYPNQNVNNQNQNVFIKFPDPKLFELDPNFLKGCNKIEKVTYDLGVYEGEMKNGKRNGKGKMTWTVLIVRKVIYMKVNGKMIRCMEKEYINFMVVRYIVGNGIVGICMGREL